MTYGESTRAVHTPPVPEVKQTPLGLPIYRTAAFAFESAQEYADILNDRIPGFTYSRIDNPTADTFAAAVASLEGERVTAQPFASGMAAISTTLMAHLSAGDHVVCQAAVYGGTWSLLEHVLRRFGVRTTFVDPVDPEAARAAVTEETKIIYGEAIANPTLTVTDIPALARIAADAGALLFIDSTFATPVVCRPLEHGADIVLHSATKYFGGHSDVTGGVAVGRPELMAPVRKLRVDLGGSLAPDEAFLLHRGISTLPLRMRQHCASASAVAAALETHPAVSRVHFPGLAGHHSHELARQLFTPGRFGGMVSIDLVGGRAAGLAFCDSLQLGIPATSLAGTHTKVSHVASTTHRQLGEVALKAAGIDASTVRISVGLEDAEDLIADMTRALDSL